MGKGFTFPQNPSQKSDLICHNTPTEPEILIRPKSTHRRAGAAK